MEQPTGGALLASGGARARVYCCDGASVMGNAARDWWRACTSVLLFSWPRQHGPGIVADERR
jgi:hypothetical protein